MSDSAVQSPKAHVRGANMTAIGAAIAVCALMGCRPPMTAMADDAPAATTDASQSADADTNPHVWKPQTQSVAVFKNGLGFFMRQGAVRLRDGWCLAEHIPPAAFGTLAIYSAEEGTAVDVVGSGPGEIVEFDGRDADDNLVARRARLEAARNLKVQLDYKHHGLKRSAAGKLVAVGAEFAILENDANSFAVPIAGVTRMQVLELPLRIHTIADADRRPDRVTLGMAYLRKGITWIPDYTLDILDEETAELTLRGTVVNQAEDLIHTDVHLVVGVPHFVHTEYVAPIAVGQVIRTIGTAVAGQAMGMPPQVATQIMNRAAIVSNARTSADFDRQAPAVQEQPVQPEGGDLETALGSLPQLGGAGATDYTVYTKNDLTLRRGERAIITLFTARIRYSHIYRWSPPERMEHSLVLHNDSGTAWTTGPCLAISQGSPLSEDLLKYTPKGSGGELPVTAAINVAHQKTEVEVERKLKAHSPTHNVSYDLVLLEGKLQLRNYEKRPVDIVITNPVPDKPIEADAGGAISVDATKLKLLERQGSVSWKVTLEPGAEKTLTYQYERYVPSN